MKINTDFLDNKSQLRAHKTCPCSLPMLAVVITYLFFCVFQLTNFITKLFYKLSFFFSFCENRFAIDLASYHAFNI